MKKATTEDVKNRSKEKPCISIVMCTYNGEKYIREQLDSLLRQTLLPSEIIIQDDCSTDNTCKIVMEYSLKHPFIKLFRNKQNKGINENFFSAIQKATCDYIAICDQDDIWEDYKLELQMKSIGGHLLCGGRSEAFSDTGAAIRNDLRCPNCHLLRQIFVGTMAGHTLFFKRELLEHIPALNTFIHIRCYDAILLIVAGALESIIYLDKKLVNHRRYSEAATYTAPTDNNKNIKNIWKSIVRTYNYNRKIKPEISRRLLDTKDFLKKITPQTSTQKKAIRMIELYTGSRFIDFLKLELFCLKNYRYFFFASSPHWLVGRIRALYFPIQLSDYYRWLIKE